MVNQVKPLKAKRDAPIIITVHPFHRRKTRDLGESGLKYLRAETSKKEKGKAKTFRLLLLNTSCPSPALMILRGQAVL